MPPKNTAVRPLPKKKKAVPSAAARITSAIRRIWAWSPLRREALRRAKGQCEECGAFEPKLEVHHENQIYLHTMSKAIVEKLFPPLDELTCVCKTCHLEKHRRDK